MIGARAAAVPPKPVAAIVWMGLAVAIVALALLTSAEVMPLALLPLGIGAALLLRSRRRFMVRFKETALEIARPPQQIAYASLLEVHPIVPIGKARPRAFAIQLVHARGDLVIPANMNVPSERLYAFLRGLLPARPSRALPQALETYRLEQEQSFGAERVWSYGARRAAPPAQGSGWRAMALALASVSGLWLMLGVLKRDQELWAIVGGMTLFIAFLVFLGSFAQRSRTTTKILAGETGLVISPLGLALQQGALTGHLTWQEITKVNANAAPTGFTVSASQQQPAGVVLEVEGATIVITDSYDRPLSEIQEQVKRYWR